MGLCDPLVCDDVDMYADDLLRREDPTLQDMLAMMTGTKPKRVHEDNEVV